MKIDIKVVKLQEILDLSSRFVSKHSTLPVLENIYIKGNIDTLLFRATDMEKYVEIELPMNIDNEWVITVNAKTFTDIIKTIDESETVQLIIEEASNTLFIKTPQDKFKIKWISASEYVAVPEISRINSVDIEASLFSEWISKVEYAVTEKNFSPVLTWVLIRSKKYDDWNKIVFVWTDSFRLAEYKIDVKDISDDLNIIIPKININDIKKVVDYFIENWWNTIQINSSNNLVSFNFKLKDMNIVSTSLLIQWNFPEYENENIIPTKFNTKLVWDKNWINKAIRKISILTRDINNFLDISVENNKMFIASWETDKWEANTELNVILDWDSVKFDINWKYISDFIKSINSDKMNINIVDSESPIVFKDNEDKNYTYIIRPLVK